MIWNIDVFNRCNVTVALLHVVAINNDAATHISNIRRSTWKMYEVPSSIRTLVRPIDRSV